MTKTTSEQPEKNITPSRNLAGHTGGGRWASFSAAAGLLALAGLLTWNVSLVRDQLSQLRQQSRSDDFWVICSAEETQEARSAAFLRLVRSGHSEWRSASLTGLDLKHTTMVDADLEKVNLTYH